ncbi:MAG TPA: glycosyltransferase [Mycobacteriales bacterium]|nr:glycosyltransferase [Mycobacteriales bacterium]
MPASAGPGAGLTVIVPTYRRPALLRRCLASLREQTVDARAFTVSVVDDGSGDETPQLLEQLAATMPNLTWAVQPRNAGPAAARNRAVQQSGGALLLFVDDDVVARPELVERHLALHAAAAPQDGFVGRVQWEPTLAVTPFMRWLDGTDLQFRYETGLQPGLLASPEEAFYTCNLSLRREVFEASGGFDERFPYPAYEDIELGWRLGRAGFRLTYAPEALAYHARAITLREFTARMEKVAESAVLLQRTHPEVPVRIDVSAPPGALAAALTATLATIVPRLGGRDVRSRHYWDAVTRAYARGRKRATSVVTAS